MDTVIQIPGQLSVLLRSLRERAELTQAALAKRLGVSQQAVSELEKAPQAASVERLLHVLTVLNVDLVLRDRVDAAEAASKSEW